MVAPGQAQLRVPRFFRTPKGLVLTILVCFVIIAARADGFAAVLPGTIAAITAAVMLDVGIVLLKRQRWELPDGAAITGLIVAMVLRPQEPLAVVSLAAIIAVACKHLLRTRWSNVCNPAALALLVAAVLFNSGESWWGALPDVGLLGIAALAGAGVFIVNHLNKAPLVIALVGGYFALFTLTSYFGNPSVVAEVYRTPDLEALLFFAFFMADDPPTCPIRFEDQIVFGLIVAFTGWAAFMYLGGVYYLLLGLVVANVWESGRRLFVATSRTSRERRLRPTGEDVQASSPRKLSVPPTRSRWSG